MPIVVLSLSFDRCVETSESVEYCMQSWDLEVVFGVKILWYLQLLELSASSLQIILFTDLLSCFSVAVT